MALKSKNNESEILPLRFRSLISLSDMTAYLAPRLVKIPTCLGMLRVATLGGSDEPMEDEEKETAKGQLTTVADEADAIGLKETAILARRIASEVDTEEQDKLFDRFQQLDELFELQIETLRFFLLSSDRIKYHENTELAGTDFKANFPKANSELIEAGNCFAFGRYTACAFHLLRALDISLAALEKQLGIVRPSAGSERTWGKTLGRIRDKIADNDKTPPPGWGTERTFFENARTFIVSVKMSARDDTMHAESSYDEQGALSFFTVSVEVFRLFATKLKE